MKSDTRTDEELMRAVQEGQTEAFKSLFERYRTPLFNFLTRMTGNNDTAADLTQDVFAKIIRNAATFHHRSRFSTWIYTVARNCALDAIRRAGHRRHASLDQPITDEGTPLREHLPGSGPEPDRDTTSVRLREALGKAIERLPDDQREVFLLREYQGIPFGEIAQIIQVPAGTVKSRMRYALESLRKSLSDYEEYARSLP